MDSSDWPRETVESLIESGAILGHKDGNYGSFYPRVSEFGSVGVPFLTAKSISDGRLNIAGAPRLANDRADTLKFGFIWPNDVLLSHNATVGRVAVVPNFDGRLLIGTSLTYFRLNPERLSTRYFAAYLTGAEFQNQLAAVMSHSTRNQVPITAQRKLTIVVPPLATQEAIAGILGPLDDKIRINRRTSDTNEALARALFKSWFVDFEPVRAKAEGRDPALSKEITDLFPNRMVESEIGESPEGWRIGTLRSAVDLIRENENPPDSPDAMYSHFSIPAFDNGHLPILERGAAIKSHKFRVPPGSVLMSKLNPEIERVWLVDVQPGNRAICSTEFLVLRPCLPFGRAYAYCLARSPELRREIEGLVTGTSKSHQRAQPNAILGLAIIKPPSALIDEFQKIAEPLLARTLECRRESRTLTALRNVLLPKLISGELRIKDAEKSIESAA